MQDSLRTERDRLLAEKDTWVKQTASTAEPVNPEVPKVWETEKAELVKLRDEALENKVAQLGANQTTATPTSAGISHPKLVVATKAGTSAALYLPEPPLGPIAAQGGAPLQGAGQGGKIGRGGAPLPQPPVNPAGTTVMSGGISIIGAASKRPWEDGSTSSDGSLAKRLTPADAQSHAESTMGSRRIGNLSTIEGGLAVYKCCHISCEQRLETEPADLRFVSPVPNQCDF